MVDIVYALGTCYLQNRERGAKRTKMGHKCRKRTNLWSKLRAKCNGNDHNWYQSTKYQNTITIRPQIQGLWNVWKVTLLPNSYWFDMLWIFEKKETKFTHWKCAKITQKVSIYAAVPLVWFQLIPRFIYIRLALIRHAKGNKKKAEYIGYMWSRWIQYQCTGETLKMWWIHRPIISNKRGP